MKTITADKASETLQELLTETATSHELIHIISDSSAGVLLSEADWRAVQETLYLLSIPGMRESIREGMRLPLEECYEELNR
jgi:Phd_YefM.